MSNPIADLEEALAVLDSTSDLPGVGPDGLTLRHLDSLVSFGKLDLKTLTLSKVQRAYRLVQRAVVALGDVG